MALTYLCPDVLKQRVDLLCYLSIQTLDGDISSNSHASWALPEIIASAAPEHHSDSYSISDEARAAVSIGHSNPSAKQRQCMASMTKGDCAPMMAEDMQLVNAESCIHEELRSPLQCIFV